MIYEKIKASINIKNIKNKKKEKEKLDFTHMKTKINIDLLTSFIDKFEKKFKYIDSKVFKRTRKLSFKDIFLFVLLKNSKNLTYKKINKEFEFKYLSNIILPNVSTTAIIKKRNIIDPIYFHQMNTLLLSFINTNNEPVIAACDGSNLTLLSKLNESGYELSPKGNYSSALLSSIIDTNTEAPINLELFKNDNERDAFKAQIGFLNRGDIIIFDRGYYSIELIKLLKERGIHYIFRCNCDYKIFENLNLNEEKVMDRDLQLSNGTIKETFKVCRYVISKDDYFIATSLIDTKIDDIKKLYCKRWKVETNFKFLKYNLSLLNSNTRKENLLKQDIYSCTFYL
jgi:hypothetical protein